MSYANERDRFASAGMHEPRGECSIEAIAEWQDGAVVFAAKKRKLGKRAGDDVFVFFRLNAARAVNESAAGSEQRHESP